MAGDEIKVKRTAPIECNCDHECQRDLGCDNGVIFGPEALYEAAKKLECLQPKGFFGRLVDLADSIFVSRDRLQVERSICSDENGTIDPKEQKFILGDLEFTIHSNKPMQEKILFLLKDAMRSLPSSIIEVFNNGTTGESPVKIFYGDINGIKSFYSQNDLELKINLDFVENLTQFSFYDYENNILYLHSKTYEDNDYMDCFMFMLHELTHAVDDFMIQDSHNKINKFSGGFSEDEQEILANTCASYSLTIDRCVNLSENFVGILSTYLFLESYGIRRNATQNQAESTPTVTSFLRVVNGFAK